MATSPHTLLRNALVAAGAADTTIRTLCGRTTACVISWASIHAATLPVVALQITNLREIDATDDPHDALVQVSCMADGARGIEVAEALAQRMRELIGTVAVTGANVAAAPDDVSSNTIDDAELVPAGRSRVDLTIRYRVEVF